MTPSMIARMALPGGTPERLTTDPTDDFSPTLSPNGREVAFHSWRSGSRDIYVMPLDGGPVQQLTKSTGQEAIATWSPDGDQIAAADFTGQGGIWIIRRKGGQWLEPVRRLNRGFTPRYSPDGSWISFSSSIFDGSIWVMPADSGDPRLLIDSTRPAGVVGDQPQWSSDGRTIYTRSHDARGNAEIWAIPVQGGTPRRLVSFTGPNAQPVRGASGWYAGHGRLVYSSEDRRSDVWVMEVAAGD